LPLFLAGCRSLVVLAGPTYFERLWCILEIFTFVYMGGSVDRVTFVPLTKQTKERMSTGELEETSEIERRLEHEQLLKQFRRFDASQAKCANPEDLDRLLGIVETACGSLDAFSRIVRETFEPRAEASFNEFHIARRRSHALSTDGIGQETVLGSVGATMPPLAEKDGAVQVSEV